MPNLVFYLLVSKNKTNKQINKKTPKKQKTKTKTKKNNEIKIKSLLMF